MLHIITNPHSGRGRLVSAEFLHQLKKEEIPFCLHITTGKGHARILVSSLQFSKDDQLLIMGGDGSLNEMVNGLSFDSLPRLLLLPTGSGNDFARGLKMKKGPSAALSLLRDNRQLTPYHLDCGEVSFFQRAMPHPRSRRFLVSCGIGYDAAVCQAMENNLLKKLCNRLHIGKLSYLLLGVREILRYKRASLTLTLNGEKPVTFQNVAFLSVHNLPYEGGGFRFAPGANARDGKLTVCLVTAGNRLIFTLTLLASFLGAKHIHLPNVRQFTCQTLRVKSDQPLPFHTDGEWLPQVTDFTVCCHERILPFLYVTKQD